MIEVRNVTKRYGETIAIEGVDARFEPGKVSMVIGRSGSGKSVLMKCMVGLTTVDSGGVFFDGESFFEMAEQERNGILKDIGMLFQAGALFDSLTVEENIMFPLSVWTKMSNAEKRDRVNFCLERVNLAGKNHLFPGELSGGMVKRVGIARAIAVQPRYLFCDEPNSGLDPKTGIVIDQLIQEITEEYNTTTVVISHDLNSVLDMGDNILFLHEGRHWWQGTKAEILDASNAELQAFVYASQYMKQIREMRKKK